MHLYLAADHRGFNLKEKIKHWLVKEGYQVKDMGNRRLEMEDDYPDFALKLARKMKEASDRGILFCGSGIGMAIAANRFSHLRCGLGFNKEQVKHGRENDDINCLSLPADFLNFEEAREIARVFLETEFDGKESHRRRIEKLKVPAQGGSLPKADPAQGGCASGGKS
ncbi:RpiB/LacA/LacB family sugar-phosphate isomerase [Candidatus Shapirobacteria bacterium]|nr:RpiB/LacA/LacB family sugar-phosphate isomerase [Candidatus Shapirobacteria bacterium]